MSSISRNIRISRGWRSWAAVVAGGWGLFYAILGGYWWAGGSGFPFGRGDEAAPGAGSLLADVDAGVGGPIITFSGLAAALLGWAMDLKLGTGWRRRLVVAAGWIVALTPVFVVMDSRSLTLVPPLGLFGWAAIDGWPALTQVLVAAGVLLWVAAATAYLGQTRSHDSRSVERERRVADAWIRSGRIATYVACLCPVPYAVIRFSWAIDRPIGVPPHFVDMLNRNQPGVVAIELVLVAFAVCGIVLTLGLLRTWGRVFPGWLPILGGRQVPLWFPVSFATCAALAIFPFGRVAWYDPLGIEVAGAQDELQLWGFDPDRSEFWGLDGLNWLFAAWAIALGLAITGYYYRYRAGQCEDCGSRASA